MRKLILITSVSMLSMVTFSAMAHADQRDVEIESMKKQIEFLMDEVKRLKASRIENAELAKDVEILKGEQAQQVASKAVLEEEVEKLKAQSIGEEAAGKLAKIEPAAGGTRGAGFETTMNPSPRFRYGDFSWQPFGVLHVDAASFNDDNFDHPDGAEMRRARIGMKGKVAENVGYVVEADFGNSNSALINAFLTYNGFENGEFRLGHNRSPYSLEASTSTDDTTFIEFSAPTAAFDVGEIVGLGGFFNGEQWSVGMGAYNQNTAQQDTDDEGWRVSGRATVAPVKTEDSLLHFGLSGAYVGSRQQTDSFVFGATAENAVQTTNSVQATVSNAENHTILGMEAAGVYGPFSIQGEYYITDVDTTASGSDVTFDGGYGQISYFLTGERRPYVDGNGTFGRIVPHEDFLAGEGWGAWELAARYSKLDLNDGATLGGKMENYTLGVNWYLNQYTRLMLNYIDTDTDDNAFSATDDDPSLLLFRGQVTY